MLLLELHEDVRSKIRRAHKNDTHAYHHPYRATRRSVRAQSTLNAGIAGLRAGGFRFFVIVKCLDSGGKIA